MIAVTRSPEVSVMIPTFNAINYIDSAVLSILSQDHHDWELLAYDDGSTDGTFERMQFWAGQDDRIRVARPFTEPRRYADMCNQMLADASGEFMARVDCDDIALPNRLTVNLDFIRRHDAAVLLGSMLSFIMEAEGDRIVDDHPMIVDVVQPVASYDDPVNDAIRSHHKIIHGGTFFGRRRAIIDAGGYDNMLPLDDWDASLRISEKGDIFVLPDVLYLKRIHAQSASKKHPNRQQAFEAINDRYGLGLDALPN